MAGDKVTATVQYYFQGVAGGNNTNFPAAVLSSMLQAISGGTAAASLVKNNASAITTSLNGVPGFISVVQPGGSNPAGNTPQAYLTILFFDERFNFIAAADGGVAQQQVAASVTANGSSLAHNDIKAPKNGYAYVYISNQSNVDVFFDNLKVQVVTGNIIEENHYYSYGLKIASISSKKLGDTYEGTLKNSYLYNDKELFEDGDLNWYDYGFRNYDPQIGRFPQLDPLTDDYPFYTPYQYAGCEPIANVDVDGLEPQPVIDGLIRAGATNFNTKIISTGTKAGAHAGKLSISFFMNGTACNLIFKIPTVSIAGMFTSVGIQAAKAVSNFVNPDLSRNVSESLNQGSGSMQNNIPEHIPQAPTNSATIGPAKELNELEKQKQKIWNEHNNVLNGYNKDGSKHWTQKLADNKTFQRAEKMTGTMATIGGAMTLVGGVRSLIIAKSGKQVLDGSFSIWNWEGYPAGIPKPRGPFRLLQGEEYAAARIQANRANQVLSRNLGLRGKMIDIHETTPVKFGGSPTNVNNKLFLDSRFHETQVNSFWDKIQKGIQ